MRSGSPAADQNIGANGGPLDGQLGRNDTGLAEVERGVNFDDCDVEESKEDSILLEEFLIETDEE